MNPNGVTPTATKGTARYRMRKEAQLSIDISLINALSITAVGIGVDLMH